MLRLLFEGTATAVGLVSLEGVLHPCRFAALGTCTCAATGRSKSAAKGTLGIDCNACVIVVQYTVASRKNVVSRPWTSTFALTRLPLLVYNVSHTRAVNRFQTFAFVIKSQSREMDELVKRIRQRIYPSTGA